MASVSSRIGRSCRQLLPLVRCSQQWQMRRRLHNLVPVGATCNRAAGALAVWSRGLSGSSSAGSSCRLDEASRAVTVKWSDGAADSVLPMAWLRDNCQCERCFHPSTLSRSQLMENFDPKVRVESVSLDDVARKCRVTWSDGHVSPYGYDWLRRRSFDGAAKAARAEWYSGKHVKWGAGQAIPKHAFGQVVKSDEALLKFLNDMEAYGLSVVENSPPPEAGSASTVTALCNRIAYPLQNNYGDTFNVLSKLDPSNLAYTPIRLGLHIDLPFYKEPPGIQMLHCVSQSAEIVGGENFFSDGFFAADLLKEQNPDAFRVLTTTLVDFYDYGTDFLKDFHMLCRQRVIALDSQGDYEQICYNNQVRDTYLNIPIDEVQPFYDSLKIYDSVLHGEQCAVYTKLKEGDIVVFDNRRVLHGRNKYEVLGKAERRLQGAYMRWDEVYSRIRRLEESVRGKRF